MTNTVYICIFFYITICLSGLWLGRLFYMYLSFLSILCYAHVFPCYVHVHINVHIIHNCQYMYIHCTIYMYTVPF